MGCSGNFYTYDISSNSNPFLIDSLGLSKYRVNFIFKGKNKIELVLRSNSGPDVVPPSFALEGVNFIFKGNIKIELILRCFYVVLSRSRCYSW